MKFWVKVVLCSVIVFMLGMDIVAYVLIEKSYSMNKENEYSAARNEQFFIQRSLQRSIASTEGNYTRRNPENLRINVIPYAEYYRQQGIYLELYMDGEQVYSSFTDAAKVTHRPELDIKRGENSRLVRNIGETQYLFMASYMDEPYSGLKFVYIKNVQELADYKKEITRYFVIISLAAAALLTLVTIGLVWRLTRPLRELNKATSEIALGDYSKRVEIDSRDEIGEFARNFNTMAGSVESHVEMLSNLTAEKQRFIDNLAHEMRTPITAILGYGEFLKYASHSEEEGIKALNYMISQSERIKNMTLKLLELAGLGKGSIHFEEVHLEDIMESVEATLAQEISEKNITVDKRLEQSVLWGDPALIESLLSNLLENAVCALPPGGHVALSTQREEKRLILKVQDNGKGIAAEALPKITEPFYRVDSSRSSRDGGAGLGLALCEQICMLHQAKMDIVSVPGEGTMVKIIFYNSMTTSGNERC